ncbi:MAG: hypothetical protein WCE73_11240 [Candidatus Angelobacter sp.]
MASNPTFYRVLANAWLYRWMVAMVLPFLIWAVLVKLSRNHPGILPRSYPWLKVLTWGAWVLFVASGLYGLVGISETKTFFRTFWTLGAFSSGTNLVYHWVRRRVDPDAYKKTEGWWPTAKDLPEAKPGKNL